MPMQQQTLDPGGLGSRGGGGGTLAEALPKLSVRLERLLLDLNLPAGSGLLLLKKVRSEGLPIL